jgi:hypothetical protein
MANTRDQVPPVRTGSSLYSSERSQPCPSCAIHETMGFFRYCGLPDE